MTSAIAVPLTALSLLLAAPVLAQTPQGCFTRSYTKAHLAAHPAQHVAALQLSFERGPEGPFTSVAVTGRFADQGRARAEGLQNQRFQQSGFCDEQEGVPLCRVECDGGSFSIRQLSRDQIEIVTDHFVLEGGAGGCEGRSDLAETAMDKTHYRLTRAPASACAEGP